MKAMATLNIRNVPDEIRTKLRVRAAKAGRSMEAEVRNILREAVQDEARSRFDAAELQDFIAGLFRKKPPQMTDELIAERRREAMRARRK